MTTIYAHHHCLTCQYLKQQKPPEKSVKQEIQAENLSSCGRFCKITWNGACVATKAAYNISCKIFHVIGMFYQSICNILDVASRSTGFHQYLLKPLGQVNPLTDRVQFSLIPTSFEKFIGSLHYPSLVQSLGGRDTSAKGKKMESLLQSIVRDLTPKKYDKDGNLLNSNGSINNNPSFQGTEDKEVTRGLEFEVTYVNSSIFNAMCLPGGKMVVTKGFVQSILDSDEVKKQGQSPRDLIATVLGHEMTHALARHGASRLSFSILTKCLRVGVENFVTSTIADKNKKKYETPQERFQRIQDAQKVGELAGMVFSGISSLFSLSHSRNHEREADEHGIRLMREAGYQDFAGHHMFHVFQEKEGSHQKSLLHQNFLSTHPQSDERVENALVHGKQPLKNRKRMPSRPQKEDNDTLFAQ